ncbi:MAG: hypothetical protein KAT77_06540 [Nanoarchaeota archaeon]|nr:hypothetical protein [Nanoarchaeota archaeon]
MESEDAKKIIKRLDILINLLLSNTQQNKIKDADKIVSLKGLGLSASEIAEITNKSRQNIDVVLRRIKQKK